MGSRTEKLLLDELKDREYEGIKVDMGGAGGFKTGHDAGDIIVGRVAPHHNHIGKANIRSMHEEFGYVPTWSELFIIEEKYKTAESNKYIQEDGEKFDAMIAFAEAIGATPVLAVRWSSNLEWSPGAEHRVIDAREVERTKSGNVSVKPATAEEKFNSVEDFF